MNDSSSTNSTGHSNYANNVSSNLVAVRGRPSSSFGYPGDPHAKIVATSISLMQLQRMFMDSTNFLDLPCWSVITHLIVEDYFQVIDIVRVVHTTSSQCLGWKVYKKMLQRLQIVHNITLLFEFNEYHNRQVLTGSLKLPCCALTNYLDKEFAYAKTGICLRVPTRMSSINFDDGFGAGLQCFGQNANAEIWLNIENPYFRFYNTRMFTGVFAYVPGTVHPNTVLKIRTNFAQMDSQMAYFNYRGMMTIPIANDRSDAFTCKLKDLTSVALARLSMLNTCLLQWNRCAQQKNGAELCRRCGEPNSICAAQKFAPGSCSNQIGEDVYISNVSTPAPQRQRCSSED